MDDPRIVMLVLLDEPKNEQWGSEAAAPIFSAIGGEVLRYLGVPPHDTAPSPQNPPRPAALPPPTNNPSHFPKMSA